jgi:hypothetical protein
MNGSPSYIQIDVCDVFCVSLTCVLRGSCIKDEACFDVLCMPSIGPLSLKLTRVCMCIQTILSHTVYVCGLTIWFCSCSYRLATSAASIIPSPSISAYHLPTIPSTASAPVPF